MTLLLVLRFQADEILILLLPLLLCGIICLVCKKHTFLWIGWVISLFLALSPYYFFWVHVNYFSWIAVFIWAFVTVGYIIGRALPRNAAESDIKGSNVCITKPVIPLRTCLTCRAGAS